MKSFCSCLLSCPWISSKSRVLPQAMSYSIPLQQPSLPWSQLSFMFNHTPWTDPKVQSKAPAPCGFRLGKKLLFKTTSWCLWLRPDMFCRKQSTEQRNCESEIQRESLGLQSFHLKTRAYVISNTLNLFLFIRVFLPYFPQMSTQ